MTEYIGTPCPACKHCGPHPVISRNGTRAVHYLLRCAHCGAVIAYETKAR